MYKFIGAEPIKNKRKKVAHTIQIVTGYDDDTKNEFYISTFAIIYIIYVAMGNVVKLRPLKTQVLVFFSVGVCVCVCGTPVSCRSRKKNSNKTIMPKCGPSNIHEADRNS